LDNSRQSGPGGDKQRKEAAKSFFALVVSVVGILLGLELAPISWQLFALGNPKAD
jgi:hypothetical protein